MVHKFDTIQNAGEAAVAPPSANALVASQQSSGSSSAIKTVFAGPSTTKRPPTGLALQARKVSVRGSGCFSCGNKAEYSLFKPHYPNNKVIPSRNCAGKRVIAGGRSVFVRQLVFIESRARRPAGRINGNSIT